MWSFKSKKEKVNDINNVIGQKYREDQRIEFAKNQMISDIEKKYHIGQQLTYLGQKVTMTSYHLNPWQIGINVKWFNSIGDLQTAFIPYCELDMMVPVLSETKKKKEKK